jgi:predicted pyridoxine 5'-phosphate oxidase superfamily flavin-nucleotide-binding protein
MAEMSKELMDLINSAPLCYLATVSKDGVPDVAPFASAIAISPDTIVMAATLRGKSVANLRDNPRAALVVHSAPPPKREASMAKIAQVSGGQIKGRATILTSGTMHEQAKSMTAEVLGPETAEIFDATVVLTVEEIHPIIPGTTTEKPTA